MVSCAGNGSDVEHFDAELGKRRSVDARAMGESMLVSRLVTARKPDGPHRFSPPTVRPAQAGLYCTRSEHHAQEPSTSQPSSLSTKPLDGNAHRRWSLRSFTRIEQGWRGHARGEPLVLRQARYHGLAQDSLFNRPPSLPLSTSVAPPLGADNTIATTSPASRPWLPTE